LRHRRTIMLLAILLGGILPSLLFSIAQDLGEDNLEEDVTIATISTHSAIVLPIETVPTEIQMDINADRYISVLIEGERVDVLDLNDYLTAVVLKEMPASFEIEALKAQAIVARTYALRQEQKGTKHEDAAVCTDSACCQGYCSAEEYLAAGGDESMLERVVQAVKETDNLVLTYNNELIDATYFSCSGGKTEDAKAVWGTEIPYLQSVESPGEEFSENYVNTVRFSTDAFAILLGLDSITYSQLWVDEITYTEGGGVDTIEICGNTYKGTKLRELLGLKSTAFTITIIGDTVTITTKGFGHRVGMSQYGAEAMAVQGSSCAEILSYYYQGAQLVLD